MKTITSKQLFFISMGVLLVGLVLGVWVSNNSGSGNGLIEDGFSTQSYGENSVMHICPWSTNITNGFRITNPLVEKSEPLIALQQGLVAKNFSQRAGGSMSTGWKAKISDPIVTSIRASIDNSGSEICVYESEGVAILELRNDALFGGKDCTPVNEGNSVGFVCG